MDTSYDFGVLPGKGANKEDLRKKGRKDASKRRGAQPTVIVNPEADMVHAPPAKTRRTGKIGTRVITSPKSHGAP